MSIILNGPTAESRRVDDFIFARRFRRLRQRMMAAAHAQGIYTDEDVFTRVS